MPVAKKTATPKGRKRSKKGALIKGMTRKLPRALIEDTTFRKQLKEIMRGYAGIYALYKKNKLYYVGLASNLFWRIHWHQRDRHAQKWDSFVIFRIKRVGYLKDIETIVLHLIDTPGNQVKGKVPRDADIHRIIKRVVSDQSRKVNQMKKALR